MTMQSSIEPNFAATDAIGCVHDLLITALGLIDELDLPGEIGAHLDLAIHKLGKFCPAGHDMRLATLSV